MKYAVIFALGLVFGNAASALERTPAPEGAEVYIVEPEDGAQVKSPVTVVFGLKGMGVAPAGVDKEGTGHHHLIVDAPLPPMNEGIPADENHIHFGGGQTETTVELEPGEHTLQMILGDKNHVPHEPPVTSDRITITVVE
ncbi:DUF4399 domain-containing protein [Dichotomicrobium thermohalophilum]|uniref:Uncharacterized protein DUF4399 n=1 Tax=Dichotomicrobium thermohalophilum TaxID=933063 RepID=A0A397Q600_9HYPH|nr:DUF4399 domain-containing protein [Dichotomicrobium thermohalophilum]RIA56920.1 uncharacterized protein DUF4399 [Dichotomicrobium thermohalophilum]